MGKEFEIRREVELPATPEEVWEAVATGSGNAAWLFPGGDVEPRVGGKTADGSTVTAWDPPHKFAVRFEGEGGFFNALEFVIEGREGGTTVLRYVHSGIFDIDDWNNQYDAANQHTDFYLHTLGQYLRYFNGRTATYIGDVPGGVNGPESSIEPQAFETLKLELGLPADVSEGDTVQLSPRGLQPLSGVVDYVRPNFVGIRTDDGLYRFYGRNAFNMPVGVAHHIFADGVDAESIKIAWSNWLQRIYN